MIWSMESFPWQDSGWAHQMNSKKAHGGGSMGKPWTGSIKIGVQASPMSKEAKTVSSCKRAIGRTIPVRNQGGLYVNKASSVSVPLRIEFIISRLT